MSFDPGFYSLFQVAFDEMSMGRKTKPRRHRCHHRRRRRCRQHRHHHRRRRRLCRLRRGHRQNFKINILVSRRKSPVSL